MRGRRQGERAGRCARAVQGVAGHCADEDEEDEQQRAASSSRTSHGKLCVVPDQRGGATAGGDGAGRLIGRYFKHGVVLLGKLSDYGSYLRAFHFASALRWCKRGRRRPLASTA